MIAVHHIPVVWFAFSRDSSTFLKSGGTGFDPRVHYALAIYTSNVGCHNTKADTKTDEE
jgi:hypothetical protein